MRTSYEIHLILTGRERPTKHERASVAQFAIAANKLLACAPSAPNNATHPKPNTTK